MPPTPPQSRAAVMSPVRSAAANGHKHDTGSYVHLRYSDALYIRVVRAESSESPPTVTLLYVTHNKPNGMHTYDGRIFGPKTTTRTVTSIVEGCL